jgi:hypothetical protein
MLEPSFQQIADRTAAPGREAGRVAGTPEPEIQVGLRFRRAMTHVVWPTDTQQTAKNKGFLNGLIVRGK